ncbi:hypothetical protein CHS0354_018236 [Potamilus streckersoni]|uniref:RING-type domain-containing protein n=1 Tax=Potamilus streckersoni TaxID=2493646 RepID=A0AAE0SJZ8_9BIVA|nr:hypothetical protein CHS0354_018236 [Potamilus streckersoni]
MHGGLEKYLDWYPVLNMHGGLEKYLDWYPVLNMHGGLEKYLDWYPVLNMHGGLEKYLDWYPVLYLHHIDEDTHQNLDLLLQYLTEFGIYSNLSPCLADILMRDAVACTTHTLDDFLELDSFSDVQNGCLDSEKNCNRRRLIFKFGVSVITRTYCNHDMYFATEPDSHSERQQTFYSEQVDSEVVGSEYYGQCVELTWKEGGVFLACVMISVLFLYQIIRLHINYGTLFNDVLKKLLCPSATDKEVRGCRVTCQLSEGIRDEDIESFSNCPWWPKGQTSGLCRVQPFLCHGKEVSEMDTNMLEKSKIHGIEAVIAQTSVSMGLEVEGLKIKQDTVRVTTQNPEKAEINDARVNVDSLKITAWIAEGTEVNDLLAKIGTVDIANQTSGSTQVKDPSVNKESWQVTAQTSVIIEADNSRVQGGTENFTFLPSNIAMEEDLTEKAEIIKIIDKSNERPEVYKFRSVNKNRKNTIETSSKDEVEIDKAVCQVSWEEPGNSNDRVPSNELVKEQFFDDGVKIDLNQSFLHVTCKYVSQKNEDGGNDLSYYHDIHQGRKQQTGSGKISELIKKKKRHSLMTKGSDARDRTVTSTTSQEWIKKNPDSDISILFRDPSLSEEKDKIGFQEHRKWPKSKPLVSGVQQEFTPFTEEPYVASSQKCKEIFDKNSDNCLIITERHSDFISLKSEKKMKAWCSKLQFIVTDNKKNADEIIHIKEGVKLFSSRKQVTSSSLRAFFETEDAGFDYGKDSVGTEMQIPSGMDLNMQKGKCGVDINERTGTEIDLKEKKKLNLRQIVWLPRNWLPLPRLGKDEIVGFVEEQTRQENGGSTLPPTEHEELKEILRRLASDNVPGPQITMKYEMLRLCTMKTFPGLDRPFAIRIIGAGFYYAGHLDQVICYCCGSRKNSWVIGDIPLLIHQKKAPNCGFLTHNALVNVPIRKATSAESLSLANFSLLRIQRSDGSNQSDVAQGESSLMLPSSEQNRVSVLNTPHQMLVTNKSLPSNQLIASERQNVLDNLQTVSTDTYSMEEPPPKYPQYAVKNMRINSFQGWPAELQQRPEEMAECGFYYAGFSDCVRCFHCGVGLRHWMSEDDPWIEHARWSTSCLYVLKMKGVEFVSLVKIAVEIAEREEAARSNSEANQAVEHSSESVTAVTGTEASSNHSTTNFVAVKDITGSTGVTGGNANEAVACSPSPGNTEIQKYLLTDAAQSVLDMGYQPKLVQQAIERVLLKKGREELTGQIIMEAVFEIEEENKKQPLHQASIQSAEINESCGKAEINTEANNKQDGQLSAEATENESSEKSQIDPEKIIREHRELRGTTLCKICLENTISIAFLPCAHLVTCSDCAPAMRKCPVCGTLIKGTVKTFYG